MNEGRFQKSETYLRKLRQTEGGVLYEAVQDSIERLAAPLREITYKETDEVLIETEKQKLLFLYSALDDDTKREMKELLRMNNALEINIDDLRQLDSLVFSSVGDQNLSLDLGDLLPSDYRVIFLSSGGVGGGFASPTAKIAYVGTGMESLKALAILSHELGHVDDFKEKEKVGIDPAKPEQERGLASEIETLRRERVANAFALRKLRPFFRDGTLVKDDVINFLKYHAQRSYDRGLGGQVGHKRSMARYARDIEDEMRAVEGDEQWGTEFQSDKGGGDL